MASFDPHQRLVEALHEPLAETAGADADDAPRLACVLAGRERFSATVGRPPGGALAALPPPFDGVDLPADARSALDDLRATLADGVGGLAAIGGDYEAALGADARGGRGQFFTPPPVAEALVRWALRGAKGDRPRVLDPAAGTGTFLLAALRRLGERPSAAQPAARLDRLVGVDVDAAALHLAGLRLAAAADVEAPARLALHHASFFDVVPAGARQRTDPAATIDPVDAVVGNPPFVRAEALRPDADHYRRHLAAFGPDGEAPLLEGDAALSRRSDAYVYFVTHATRFLRPGGRLALVLPTKWLMSAYGEGLRRFVRERYRVHAVVGFDGRTFGDALVDTALVLAERDGSAATGAPLHFVHLDGPADPDGLLAAVSGATGGPRTVEQTQGALTASGSLARYLEAPGDLLALLESDVFVRLDALAEVSRGTMTGANRFFFVDDADVERFDLEARFRRPAVKSLRSVDRPAVGPGDVGRQVVDCHTYVADVRDGLDGGADPETAVKRALAADGHDGLLAYVEHAEREGWHEGRTCRSRPVWFDLGPLRAPAAFVPKLLRERVFAVRNAAGAVPSNAIDGAWPRDGVEAGALLAVLNASVGRAAMEVTGRDEAGLLQLMTYETASLPTPDVRTLSPASVAAMAAAGEAYANEPSESTLRALDRAVDDAFDLGLPPARLRALATTIRRQRVDGGESVDAPAD